MADSLIQVAPDGAGKKVDNTTVTTGVGEVYRQTTSLGDPSTSLRAQVLDADPPTNTPGIAVRIVGPLVITPMAHASSHITGGGDVIPNAVAGGNAGLLSGTDKTKLDGIAAGAEVNVNPDWNAVAGDAQILNKPTNLGGWTVIANADTGTVNNWAPTGMSGNTLVEWNGAADFTPTGLAGGYAGQMMRVRNASATKLMNYPHLGASLAANQFTNHVTSAPTPVFTRGWIDYQHDGTNWKIVGHEQGAWINVAYNATDFSGVAALTWTVDAGDLSTFRYKLDGTTLFLDLVVESSSTGGTADSQLWAKVPGGFIPSGVSPGTGQTTVVYMYRNGGAYTFDGGWNTGVGGGDNKIRFYKGGFGGSNWVNTTNTTAVYYSGRMEVN